MIKAIDTIYNGYRFRSRLEARWAVFFDSMGIKYEYEKEGYDLGDAGYYLPDFWLPDLDMFIEVKGCHISLEDSDKAEQLALQTRKKVGVVFNIPKSQDCFDDPYARIYRHDFYDECYGFCQCDECGKIGFEFSGRIRQCNCSENDRERGNGYNINKAYDKARQARFEHGEDGN